MTDGSHIKIPLIIDKSRLYALIEHEFEIQGFILNHIGEASSYIRMLAKKFDKSIFDVCVLRVHNPGPSGYKDYDKYVLTFSCKHLEQLDEFRISIEKMKSMFGGK